MTSGASMGPRAPAPTAHSPGRPPVRSTWSPLRKRRRHIRQRSHRGHNRRRCHRWLGRTHPHRCQVRKPPRHLSSLRPGPRCCSSSRWGSLHRSPSGYSYHHSCFRNSPECHLRPQRLDRPHTRLLRLHTQLCRRKQHCLPLRKRRCLRLQRRRCLRLHSLHRRCRRRLHMPHCLPSLLARRPCSRQLRSSRKPPGPRSLPPSVVPGEDG
mmetsp:Transcript_73512/g.219443  ORF Transcript_73512/g.219443 Transcript_73512/m.219443 type:complete len:210 (-) Transcript_73512:36-665(-)